MFSFTSQVLTSAVTVMDPHVYREFNSESNIFLQTNCSREPAEISILIEKVNYDCSK